MDQHRDSNMTTGNVVISWGIAALAGLFAFLLLLILGEWSYSAAGFGAAAIVGVLAVIFTIVFGRDLRPIKTPAKELHPRPVGRDAPLPTRTAAPMMSKKTPETSAPIVSESASVATSAGVTGTPLGERVAQPQERTEAPFAGEVATSLEVPPTQDIKVVPPVTPLQANVNPMSTRTSEASPALSALKETGGAPLGSKPVTLDAPRSVGADDLKQIRGVGPKLEKLLNDMGFWHFDQIASWTEEEIVWVDSNLEGVSGRVARDEWVAQAQALSGGAVAVTVSKIEDDGGR